MSASLLKRKNCQVSNDTKKSKSRRVIDISTMFLEDYYDFFRRQPRSLSECKEHDKCFEDFMYFKSLEHTLYCKQVIREYQLMISHDENYDCEYDFYYR